MSHKKYLSLLGAVALLAGYAQADNHTDYTNYIPARYVDHYHQAQQVLPEAYPDFVSDFETYQNEIRGIHSDDTQALYRATMRFFPALKRVSKMPAKTRTDVVVSYFHANFRSGDQNPVTVNSLLFQLFQTYISNGDAMGILSEEDLIAKFHCSQQEAQNIRTVLHALYPTRTLL